MPERESPRLENKKVQVDTLANLLSKTEKIPAFCGKKFAEVFSNDKSIRSLIEGLDETSFINLLDSINGIIRGVDEKDWAMSNVLVPLTMNEGVRGMESYTPPNVQDRKILFSEVLEAMQEMIKGDRSLEDIAILLSGTINAIHAYPDANGLSSRLLYLLLTKGLNKESESVIKQVLSKDGRDVVDVNPEKVENELQNILIQRADFKRNIGIWESEQNRNDISTRESLPDELRLELLEMLADITYSSIALHKYLNNKTDDEKKYLKNYPKKEVSWGGQVRVIPERNNVLVEDLFKDLDEIKAQEVLSIYRQIKVEMVHILIDSVVHPDKIEYTDKDGKTILERFKQKL